MAPPALVTTGDTVTIYAAKELAACLATSEKLIAYALDENGRPRNVRLLLAASEHRRRVIETAARCKPILSDSDKIDIFNDAVFSEISKESPETVIRILDRLRDLSYRAQACFDGKLI
jgi:hypothetical protein